MTPKTPAEKIPPPQLDWPENDWMKAATDLPSGTIVRDWFDEGVRIVIMRGPSSFNCYLGIPESHPLAGFVYDDIPLDIHGGLTFSAAGKTDKYLPKDFWWYGCDYSHGGDRCFYDLQYPRMGREDDKQWTIKDIKEDMWSAIYDFKKLIKLAEKIAAK